MKLCAQCICFAGAFARFNNFPNGNGQIWLDNVRCTGDEDRLIDCMANALGSHNCVHNEDAGVLCLPPTGKGLLQIRTCFLFCKFSMHCINYG